MAFYRFLTLLLWPVFGLIVLFRCVAGKADSARAGEYYGWASLPRPGGRLVWVHAASVGEAQAALQLIVDLKKRYGRAHVLVTTGTRTSAALMEKRLPEGAFHQYAPLDHPVWVGRFMRHWRPDVALWIESELWPNMLMGVFRCGVPAFLVNARMSARSAVRWRRVPWLIAPLVSGFRAVFAQTAAAAAAYRALGAGDVRMAGNIKYGAAPLGYDAEALGAVEAAFSGRPVWVFASTHVGEEALACRVHVALEARYPDLLTVIVPRHPGRRQEIEAVCVRAGVSFCLRGDERMCPSAGDGVYVVDTLGELGLFYRACPVAVIGRSFSDDGGGGHNPIEAAQLGAAVLTGPCVQYQQEIFDAMVSVGAVEGVADEAALVFMLDALLGDERRLQELCQRGAVFVEGQAQVLSRLEADLFAIIDDLFEGE